ncbi:pyruvate kinase [Thermanaerovibrio acidaminovorans]|uniref:pyruvate kinase n=1 Tax=Thermanaerovibrio acidaminovorans TaxID=81462 RepID=UPI0024933588|nr:pyruvate kinase [Thermanaerovibrio acidaminovorans]
MRHVKIVCTLGPACSDYDVLRAMAEAGMNVARFNFSHGEYETHELNLKLVRQVEQEIRRPIATLLDTKGPEIRTGLLKDHAPVILHQGKPFDLVVPQIDGDERGVSISYPNITSEVSPGMDVFIDDGTIHLRVERVYEDRVSCKVLVGGELGERKGVNIPEATLSVPTLTSKDIEDIRWGVEKGMDYIAVSFVRTRDDIIQVRRVLEELGGTMKIIAKIETRQAFQNLEEIAQVVDGMMVARGDLGVEMPTEDVPLAQKRIVDICRLQGKPVIVATQMLDSMIRNPRPTRAEANDVANAVLDGADAVMLSGETAKGKYPVQAVETMSRIVNRAEKEMRLWQRYQQVQVANHVADAVSHAAMTIAEDMKAAAIISLTRSGSTARMVSKYRPQCPIVAATPSKNTWRELALMWGVYPVMRDEASNAEEAVEAAMAAALEEGFVSEGDLVVITAGVPVGIPGTTNMVQVYTIGQILVKGLSLIKREASGFVCRCRSAKEALEKMRPGDVLVVEQTDKDYVPAMKKAAAIITEEGGLTSHAAIVALELGIPCVVSAKDCMKLLQDGMLITVDGTRGVVYQGRVKLR